MINSMIAKALKGLPLRAVRRMRRAGSGEYNEEKEGGRRVPEGHFAVVAVKGEERKRFIVKLECLRDPEFLRLLELAREEYGFAQKGALALPCNPQELHNIIHNHRCTT